MLATNDDNVSSHILIIFNYFIYCKFRYAKPEQMNHTSFRYLVLKVGIAYKGTVFLIN